MRYLKHLTIGIMILGFFLLRPYQMQNSGLLYAGDDQAYMAHATSIAFLKFPSYENEDFYEKGVLPQPKHSIGPGIMASPFVFLGALIDRSFNSPLIQNRTAGGIGSSWMVFGFVIATLSYFYRNGPLNTSPLAARMKAGKFPLPWEGKPGKGWGSQG